MSPETRMLMAMYEDAAYQFGQTYSAANERRLEQARADFLEALYADWKRARDAA